MVSEKGILRIHPSSAALCTLPDTSGDGKCLVLRTGNTVSDLSK